MKEFEELLNEVLREDAAAEPRGGLEARVMARVRGEGRRSFAFGLWNRGWSWLVPAAVCAGIVAAMWFVPRREGIVAPVSSVSSVASVPSPEVAGLRGIERGDSLVESKGGLNSGGSGRALRDAHRTTPPASWRGPRLRRDEAAAKMGHRDVLPKRDVFPSPAPVEASLSPVGVEDAQAAARELNSVEAVEALLDLRREQAEPVRVAAIHIAPLVADEDGQQVQ